MVRGCLRLAVASLPPTRAPSPPQATARLRKNASYFRVNYLILLLSSVGLGFLMHPSSLFVLAAVAVGWVYVFAVRSGPLVINGRELRCVCVGGGRAGANGGGWAWLVSSLRPVGPAISSCGGSQGASAGLIACVGSPTA